MESKIVIDIWTDIICPYCWLGKTRLEKALRSSPLNDKYILVHRAFRLAPGSAVQKVEEALAAKMNTSIENVLNMQKHVEAMAAQDGLKYDLHGTLYGDTLDSHRLVLWAAEKNLQQPLLNRFYSAYFSEHLNIFERETQLNLVESVGLSREEASQVLTSDQFKDEVEDDESQAYSFGAQGVPFFVFANKFAVGGAQPVDTFTKVIEQVNASLTKST